ncbi:MAG TPA: hypothetical protein VN848_02760 [Gemmatimonadales bacterium]|nr:hypothetical protein [Gemmatimonadales bacterium]
MRAALWLAASLGAGRAGAQTAKPAAPIIDTIVVVNHNIFDENQELQLGFMARFADAIHIRTRTSVIRRSLLLNQGDPYDSARVVESERALRALNVFRQVEIDTERLGDRLALRVETADGWSTKPQFNWASSGGDVSWVVGMIEDNLIGTATALTALYSKTPDRSAWSFLYQNPHFLWRRPRLAALYQDLSDGRSGSWTLSLPFYETAAQRAIGTSGEATTARVLEFRDGQFQDSTERHALRFSVGGGFALHATSHGYLRLWGAAAWRREDFVPESTTVVPYSTFGTVGAGFEIGSSRFVILEHFNTFARREDEDLSQTLRFGLWAAPRAWGYGPGQAGIGAELSGQTSISWPFGFIVIRGQSNGVYTGSGFDSTRVTGAVTLGSQNFARQSIVIHYEGGELRNPKPGAQFDTWAYDNGPRLFPAHAFTGTRMAWFAVEDRILVNEEVMDLLGVGLAPFYDWGGAWYSNEPSRTGGDVGLALRLGPTRAVEGSVEEIDFGWRFGAGFEGSGPWALTIREAIFF